MRKECGKTVWKKRKKGKEDKKGRVGMNEKGRVNGGRKERRLIEEEETGREEMKERV